LASHPDEYMISVSGALYRYNEKTKLLTLIYAVENYNPLNYVTTEDWVIDYNNTLWLASNQEGLIGLDATSYEEKYRVNGKTGLKAMALTALQIDHFGFLWMSSNNGLYRLDLNSMQVHAYTVKDGLTVNEFNYDSQLQLSDGRLAFGSTRGMLTLAPQDFLAVPADSHRSETEITDITLFSRELNYHPQQYAHKNLQLSDEDLGLEVSFSNFDFQNIDKTRYKISLHGPSSVKYDEYKSNKLFFTKLPPGDYTLSIATYNLDSAGLGDTKTLKFNVAYAPWRSPLAITAYALIIFAVLFFIFWQYRTKQQTIAQSHNKVLHLQQQTELALSSSNSGVWEVSLTTDAGTQHRLIKELGYLSVSGEIGFAEFSKLIHPEDIGNLMQEWARFIS
ncbi:triple tyrosine motif-containing protein, partial [Pseudoalteromonas prydzensis]